MSKEALWACIALLLLALEIAVAAVIIGFNG